MSRFFFIILIAIFSFSGCQNQKKKELSSLAPRSALAFIESGDLSKTLNSLTANRSLQEHTTQFKDFSFLKNIQIAIIVNNFQTSEQNQIGDNAILNFKPQFVVVAETHLWHWQAVSLVENQLGNFVLEKFGADVELKQYEKDSGGWFEWTAKDARKAFALVDGGRIYFANNKDSINESLFVSSGKTESLKTNDSFNRAYASKPENNRAFGYISANGLAQIANYVSISLAVNATESETGRSFFVSVLPKILHNNTGEIIWTATETENKMTDNFAIASKIDSTNILKNTDSISVKPKLDLLQFVPTDILSITRYNLQNPSQAWRNMLSVIAQNVDRQSEKVLLPVSNNLLNSYAIADADSFLAGVDSDVLTLRFDAENDKSAIIAFIRDTAKIKKSIIDQINFRIPPKNYNDAEIWESADHKISAAFVGNILILSDTESVYQCLMAKSNGRNFTQNPFYKQFSESKATATTFGVDPNAVKNISALLGSGYSNGEKEAVNYYLTETSFTEKGIERKTVSDFGMIGTILELMKKAD